MSLKTLSVGFVPLVDAAPLVVAAELGFAEAEGVHLALSREPSWSAVRDKLALGALDAAQMLSPVPIAMSMGVSGLPSAMEVLSVLSVNGNVVGVTPALAARMRGGGWQPARSDAAATGRALIAAAEGGLTIGVPFPFSMHAELLYYWLGKLGLAAPAGLDVRTIPPPRMAEAMGAGEIDAFCVGEPWGSVAAEAGAAEIVLAGRAIWQFAPEKVLAVRGGWAEAEPAAATALLRGVWRAARWLADPDHRLAAAEILAGEAYLDLPSEVVDRTLAGRVLTAASGEERRVPQLIEFFDGAATFPWRSQALWIAERMAARMGLDRAEAARAARRCFRADLHRQILGPIGADLPGASEKIEGSLHHRTPVASATGEMFLGPDAFFDGIAFDPERDTQS
ncbi:CmpA/NrtA family ABC transporter substrate-binding protein [Paralimibaculum aggregatum]|uniref:CmpA/NrtA family ABC transporter substrate-binding protein n=1 Tax=Paralimibaculum aggregatum TaxID=3036245 RepID=A0ABQ6LPL6_9RHOB|nr:CmpA/NrtA family ABC transporter substrate-binding protein [Limibaculum sp. NKW23]GMG82431.1 CmpA/NrtA family ABC transporter substrate-binding protein [Limibaculum sp. NKW23]